MNSIVDADDALRRNTTLLGASNQTDDAPDNFEQPVYYDIALQAVIVLGICGNALNLLVLSRPSLRGVTYVYLFWLALSDLLYLLVNSPVYVLMHLDSDIMFGYYPMFAMCRLTFALGNMFCASSAFIVTVLTMDRHRAVCSPLKCRDHLSRRRAAITIFCSFALAISIYIPVLFQTELEEFVNTYEHTPTNGPKVNMTEVLYSCKLSPLTDMTEFKIYVYFRETIARVIPIIVVTLLNIRIIFALRKHQQERKNLSCSVDRVRAVEERRLVYLLVTIVLMFLICTTPQTISWVIVSKSTIEKSSSFNIFDSICDLLVAINAASNFYLYCFCSTAVRKAFVHLLKKLCLPMAVRTRLPWSISLTTSRAPLDNSTTQSSQSTQHTAVSHSKVVDD